VDVLIGDGDLHYLRPDRTTAAGSDFAAKID